MQWDVCDKKGEINLKICWAIRKVTPPPMYAAHTEARLLATKKAGQDRTGCS